MFLNWLPGALMLLSQTLLKAFHKHPDIFFLGKLVVSDEFKNFSGTELSPIFKLF